MGAMITKNDILPLTEGCLLSSHSLSAQCRTSTASMPNSGSRSVLSHTVAVGHTSHMHLYKHTERGKAEESRITFQAWFYTKIGDQLLLMINNSETIYFNNDTNNTLSNPNQWSWVLEIGGGHQRSRDCRREDSGGVDRLAVGGLMVAEAIVERGASGGSGGQGWCGHSRVLDVLKFTKYYISQKDR